MTFRVAREMAGREQLSSLACLACLAPFDPAEVAAETFKGFKICGAQVREMKVTFGYHRPLLQASLGATALRCEK